MTDIPFADKETDLATEPNDEEYPTVYSTEDAPSGISALAQELAGLDEAA